MCNVVAPSTTECTYEPNWCCVSSSGKICCCLVMLGNKLPDNVLKYIQEYMLYSSADEAINDMCV